MSVIEFLSEYGGAAFPFPKIAGTFKGKNLIICADAANVWTDLEAFGARCDSTRRGCVRKDGWDVLTVNKIVETFPGEVHHAYSNMPRILDAAFAARRDEYKREFGFAPQTHSCNAGARWHWPWSGHGTSGLGAILCGLAMGYDKIVLCGMGLEDGPHNGEPHWRKTAFATSETAGSDVDDRDGHWKRAMKAAFEGKVRSMSGRTKAWLGDALVWK